MDIPLLLGNELFDQLTARARASQRRRMNLNLHPSPSSPAHRFLNAMEPDSYGAPHRHLAPGKDETTIVLRGRFGFLVFDEQGKITTKAILGSGCDAVAANVPAGTFHCLVSLEPGGVLMEAKAGPYDRATDKDWAPWAPAEGAAGAAGYLEKLRRLFKQPT